MLRARAQSRIDKSLGDFSILASNCIGGFLYHYHGLRFASPTINLLISSPDLVKFALDLDGYLAKPLVFIKTDERYPVATLGDLTIKFVHYETDEEAAEKWYERALRVNKERIFVILTDRDGLSEEDLQRLDESTLANVLVLSSRNYPQHRCTVLMKRFEGQDCVGNSLIRSIFTGYTRAQDAFDFPGWFNQEKGAGVKQYAK